MPLRFHHSTDAATDTPPFILRVAGLPKAQLTALLSRFATEELPLCLESEEASKGARERLEFWISQEIGIAAAERRSRLLTLRRNCRSGKSLERYREFQQLDWMGEGCRRIEEALVAERQLCSAWTRFEAAYEEMRQRQGVYLLEFVELRGLLRGLAMGSTSLIAGLRQRHSLPGRRGRKERRLEETLARYVSRATLKLSPFSTLTYVALTETCDTGKRLSLRGHERRQRSLVRVPRHQLEASLSLLRYYPPFRERLSVALNEAREEVRPGRWRLLRPSFWRPDPELPSGRYVQPTVVETDIKMSLISWLAMNLEEREMTYRDLAQRLACELDQDCRGELDKLLDLGFLLLRFPWNTDDPHLEARLLEHVESMPEVPGMEDLAGCLVEILALEDEFPASRCPEILLARCRELSLSLWDQAARLAGIDPRPEPPPEGRSALHEDVFLALKNSASSGEPIAQVGHDTVHGLLRTLEPLTHLAAVYDRLHDFLASLAAHCAETFPGETEISFLRLIRAAYPLWQEFALFEREAERTGLPSAAAFNPYNLTALDDWRAVRERLSIELASCVEPEDDVTASLSSARLRALLASLPARRQMPRVACFFLQPSGPWGDQWVLNRVYEGGRHHSRYLPVMGEEARAAVTALYRSRSVFEQDGETWEILDVLSPAGRAINAHVPQTPRVLEMPGERSSEPASNRLSLRDLRVVLPGAGGLPFLADREGRRVLPLHGGPILLRHMPLPLKLLRAFGPGRVDLVLPETPPEIFGDVLHRPRLAIGNVILRRRSWAVTVEGFRRQVEGLSPARFFAAVEQWRRARGIPDQVFLPRPAGANTHRDKPLFIDFNSPIFVELFRQRLVASEQLVMEEVLPSVEEGIPDESGTRWAVELQLDSLVAQA
jgi:hypothetical protein